MRESIGPAALAVAACVVALAACEQPPINDFIVDAHPRVWRAPSLEDAFVILPCGAFRKNENGSWTLVGRITVDTEETFTDYTLPADAGKGLDGRCGDELDGDPQ